MRRSRSRVFGMLAGVVLGCSGSEEGKDPALVASPGVSPIPVEEGPFGPTVPLPVVRPTVQNCEVRSQSEQVESCELNLTCASNDDVDVSCVESDGAWVCDCRLGSFSERYQLGGVDAGTACSTTLEYCLAGPAEFTGAEVCGPVALPGGEGYCQEQIICTRNVYFGEGVTAALETDNTYATCDVGVQSSGTPDTGALDCSCLKSTLLADGTRTLSPLAVTLKGSSLDVACGSMRGLCTNPALAFSAQPSCMRNESVTLGRCDIQVACTQSVSLTQGTTAEYVNIRFGACSGSDGVSSRCLCKPPTGDLRHVEFVIDAPTNGLDNCNLALSICASEGVTPPGETFECLAARETSDDSRCDADFICTQPLMVDGRRLDLEAHLGTRCSLVNGPTWGCRCTSGLLVTDLTVDANDASEACGNAAVWCQDAGVLELGVRGASVF